MNARMAFEAYPVGVQHPLGDVGPCQAPGCANGATVVVRWEIDGHGEASTWLCDEHQPLVGQREEAQ